MNIFVFGTLLSETFRRIVLGRELNSEHICTASLKNFCVYWAEGGPFPVIVPKDGTEVHGSGGGAAQVMLARKPSCGGSQLKVAWNPLRVTDPSDLNCTTIFCIVLVTGSGTPVPWSVAIA